METWYGFGLAAASTANPSEIMEIDPVTLPWRSLYKILTGAVLPRPVGWISTVNKVGQPNLAPFSFFTVVCANPPTLLFCPMTRSTDSGSKDTLNNLRASGEFVVNIVTEQLADAMTRTSVETPPEVNEFEYANLSAAPSFVVQPPRVEASPIHFECKLNQIVEISAQPGGGNIVIGTIVHIHVDEQVLLGEDKIDLEALKPIGRLAGNAYVRMSDVFGIDRPKSQLTPRKQEE
jgi:flavin reductase (DIM6/NTAB) family NADH-FMN oxidoreductase RutF